MDNGANHIMMMVVHDNEIYCASEKQINIWDPIVRSIELPFLIIILVSTAERYNR
jgi:hypothetical protein